MAKTTAIVCDAEHKGCLQPASTYRLWRDGDRMAWSIDLCELHARPLLELIAQAQEAELPGKPRVKMEPTQLRATAKTAHLKK